MQRFKSLFLPVYFRSAFQGTEDTAVNKTSLTLVGKTCILEKMTWQYKTVKYVKSRNVNVQKRKIKQGTRIASDICGQVTEILLVGICQPSVSLDV